MTQSVASRPSRPRQTQDTDDVLMARALEFSAWARRNVRMIIVVAIAAAALIGGFLWYRANQIRQMELAATEFLQLQQTAASGNVALATRDLEAFIQEYRGTPYADEARILLGQLHLQAGEPARAAEALRPFSGEEQRLLGVQGASLLAAAELEAGNTEQAIETYLRIGRAAPHDFQRQEALISAATIREQLGQYGPAAELYREALELAPEGAVDRSLLEMRLAEAEGRAAAQ